MAVRTRGCDDEWGKPCAPADDTKEIGKASRQQRKETNRKRRTKVTMVPSCRCFVWGAHACFKAEDTHSEALSECTERMLGENHTPISRSFSERIQAISEPGCVAYGLKPGRSVRFAMWS